MGDMDRLHFLMNGMMFAFFLVLLPQSREHGFLVVTSQKSQIESLTSFQLKQIYLGRLDRLKGIPLTPLQLKKGDPLRRGFETYLFGELFDLENYWLGQSLKLEAEPPMTVGSWALILAFVERNPGFIGYLPEDRVDALARYRVKILRIEE